MFQHIYEVGEKFINFSSDVVQWLITPLSVAGYDFGIPPLAIIFGAGLITILVWKIVDWVLPL